jgi:CheY-like chemotaxis protein
MPLGGRLVLETGLEGDAPWIEVSDTGDGIPEEIQDQLFEPFFTTKERGKGTGLGLSVVHSIVTGLGGRIDLESQVGQGTTIRVIFPAASHPGETGGHAAEGAAVTDGDGERVLVVEDDPAVRTSLEEILDVLGYRVATAGSREEASLLGAQSGFDLLLSDYLLPDGSGIEIAEDLRQQWPNLHVIIMSGYAQDAVVGHQAAIGNLHFLQKPFNAKALSEAVRTALTT